MHCGTRGPRESEARGRVKKLIALADWLAQVGRPDCDECKLKYTIGAWDSEALKRVKERGPQCDKCFPGVLPENLDAYELARRVVSSDGQFWSSLESAMRIYRVPVDDRAEIADKVAVISAQYCKRKRQQFDEEQEKIKHAQGRDSLCIHPRPSR